jgi:hypothetical protein
MQLTLDLEFTPAPPVKPMIQNNLWIDVSPEARFLGFTQKVEISQSLSDALQPLRTEDEDAYNQRLYETIWLAHHYWCLDQCPSYSFTFDFLRDDLITGKPTEGSLRLHVEVHERTAQVGLSKTSRTTQFPYFQQFNTQGEFPCLTGLRTN